MKFAESLVLLGMAGALAGRKATMVVGEGGFTNLVTECILVINSIMFDRLMGFENDNY